MMSEFTIESSGNIGETLYLTSFFFTVKVNGDALSIYFMVYMAGAVLE